MTDCIVMIVIDLYFFLFAIQYCLAQRLSHITQIVHEDYKCYTLVDNNPHPTSYIIPLILTDIGPRLSDWSGLIMAGRRLIEPFSLALITRFIIIMLIITYECSAY